MARRNYHALLIPGIDKGLFTARDLEASSSQTFTLASTIQPGTDDFWLSVWSKAESLSAQHVLIHCGGWSDAQAGFIVYRNATEWLVAVSNGTTKVAAGYADTTVGQWQHVAVNFDADDVFTFYRNGTAVTATYGSTTMPGGAIAGTIKEIGSYDHVLHYYDGGICGVGVGIGSLLDTDNIAELRGSGHGRRYATMTAALKAKLTHWWDGSEKSGNLIDSVGSNTGSAVNAPLYIAGPQ